MKNGGDDTMSTEFATEVIELHRYLEHWLKGETPRGDGVPKRLLDALAEDFEVIHPNGSFGRKADVLDAFARSYGEKPSDYTLTVSEVKTRRLTNAFCLATYREDHGGETGRARVSTALLRHRPDGKGIEWVFLQETPFAAGLP